MTLSLCTWLIWLCTVTGYLCDQCREGVSFANAVIPANLQNTHPIRVPNARTMSDCILACCNHSGCDLAWVLGRQCYIVSCQHKESCEPQKFERMQSYLTFVLRPAPRFISLPLFENFVPNGKYLLGDQSDAEEHMASLKELSSLIKNPSLEELPDYTDDYGTPQLDLLHPNPSDGDKPRPDLDFITWLMPDAAKNITTVEVGRRNDDDTEHPKEDFIVSKAVLSNVSETLFGDQLTTAIPQAETVLPREKETIKQLPTPIPNSASLDKVLADVTDNHPTEKLIPEHQEVAENTANSLPSYPSITHNALPTATAQYPMLTITVSTAGNMEVDLPTHEVQLNVFVSPEPQANVPYTYEWSLIKQPADFHGELKLKNTKSPIMSNVTAGLYTLRVAVSGEHASGEGFLNVTIKPAARLNLGPVAVVSPRIQEVSLPSTSVFIDGLQSSDDDKIMAYLWEEIAGPSHDLKTIGEESVLPLSDLEPGNYTYRLTVTDSDGATNFTEASVIVHKPVDKPPIANAGPNQIITLPQNHIDLNANQSKDDHEIIGYEWSLSPSSNGKVVTMQGERSLYLQAKVEQAGEYVFQLTVTDSAKQKSTAQVTVTVEPENNSPPVAEAGPDKELTFPVESTTLDGSKSKDDHGIVSYEWENLSGPTTVTIQNNDKPVAVVSDLHIGTYRFRLTVKDQQGLSSTAPVSITVKEGKNSPPKAHAGGTRVLVFPNNSISLDGSKSVDNQGIVSYQWSKDGQSPAAGDVMDSSEHRPVLQLANLVEGIYLFHLKVTDAKGESDMDTATVEVRPDPRKQSLVELILEVSVSQLSEQQKDTLVRQLAVLLNVLDSDVKVQKIQAHSDLSTMILFYVQSGHPVKTWKATDVKQTLQNQLLKEKADFLLYKVLRVDTAVCLLKCSGHGHCDPITKSCLCYPFWMENFIQRYVSDGESNCDWSVLYITVLTFALVAFLMGMVWVCICCYKSRKRTKIRKKTKYTILDNFDDQERMALRPKYGIKHRSTEHNSSLMVSESEFDSDQDTIFSRDKADQENPKNISSGALKNGAPFNFSSKCR
ncbi:PREDICTED: dyslexia-associated protein KIAA0319 homolog [Nanorana parkeri]|uniref:dyslexia-associated protein KIAA0319 homolog n=1 Tax=Nanorana parkeri TaxID=125878 RepID=UPI0008546A94|nr:PREDICTED: dyslexia-associated protein KIAA0319 homolog [Nanorana parkeri]